MKKSQPDLISAFSKTSDTSRYQPYLSPTLFQHFQQCNTPAVPYFSNCNSIKPQQYFTPAFSLEVNPNRTLFLLFEQYNTPAVPQPYLILTFWKGQNPSHAFLQHLKKIKTLGLHYFSIFNNIRPDLCLIFTFSTIYKAPVVPQSYLILAFSII